ncbi:hypothetical protein EAX61_08660 [Dokdonia sinensis]|uniref:Uncharacterized protein n=1 Tax=Dokdonia sinensis TaxID=2479847 RepID=A0A3M0GC59_9FLAO|nr:hypothetical protein [Dokdonia sinensis]RMB59123.1 hypothetical protein EAX61_08660 [Dokdonia sinensis]
MKYLLLPILLTLTSVSVSQEKLIDIKLASRSDNNPIIDYSFEGYDEKTGELGLFLFRIKSVEAVLLDSSLKTIKSTFIDTYDSVQKVFLASQISDKKAILWFTDNSLKVFKALTFDFVSKKMSIEIVDLKFKKETFLGAYNEQGKTYFISVKDKSSVILVRTVTGNEVIAINEVAIRPKAFKGYKNKSVDLYELVSPAEVISNKHHYYLFETANPTKLYPDTNGFKLTVDENDSFTYLIDVNTNDYSKKIKVFRKADLFLSGTLAETNSLLHNYKITTVASNNFVAKFKIYDALGAALINEFEYTYDEPKTRNTAFVSSYNFDFISSFRVDRVYDTLSTLYTRGFEKWSTTRGIQNPSIGVGSIGRQDLITRVGLYHDGEAGITLGLSRFPQDVSKDKIAPSIKTELQILKTIQGGLLRIRPFMATTFELSNPKSPRNIYPIDKNHLVKKMLLDRKFRGQEFNLMAGDRQLLGIINEETDTYQLYAFD